MNELDTVILDSIRAARNASISAVHALNAAEALLIARGPDDESTDEVDEKVSGSDTDGLPVCDHAGGAMVETSEGKVLVCPCGANVPI